MKRDFWVHKYEVDGKIPCPNRGFKLSYLGNLIANWLNGECKMLEIDHLELQDKNQEPITRPKLKRLILEYLQKRSRKEILLEDPVDEGSGSLE